MMQPTPPSTHLPMTDKLWLMIDWRDADADLPESAQERLTEGLLRELMGCAEVEQVERVADPDVPEGGMGAAWLWGILQAEVTGANAIKAAKAVQERLPGKPISFTIKDGDKQIKATNISPKDLESVLDKLVEATRNLGDSKGVEDAKNSEDAEGSED
jgi:hypothetical protein